MTYKEIYRTKVDRHKMLYQIAPYDKQGLPPNSIFFKGRCGIGGTTLEIMWPRHSIIVVPNTTAIQFKCADPDLLEFKIHGVMGEKNQTNEDKIQKIMEVLKRDGYIKIMTTPDSFKSIIDAAERLGKLDWLYENFFLCLDECHSYVTEAFRENITIPFRYLWNFKMKCLISATPFEFSDPRFAQLDKHEIIINEPLGEIELIETDDIGGVFNFLLSNPQNFPGNVHIFYNSITKLADKIKHVLKDNPTLSCNVYCSPTDENKKKLELLPGVFKENPVNGEYRKFSIYTTRSFEAWDLKDKDATIILITDVSARNTKVGITNKGFQAIGRLRGEAHRIIHITNHAGKDYKRELQYFKKKHTIYALDTIKSYNYHASNCKNQKLKPYKRFKEAVESYAEVSTDSYSATLEIIKIDQLANHDSCNEEYNNMKYIREAWESSNYAVLPRRVRAASIPNLNKVIVAQQLEIAFKCIDDLEANKHNLLFSDDYEIGKAELIKVNKLFELIFKAYYTLGRSALLEMGFDKQKLKAAMKKFTLETFKRKVSKEIPKHFKLGVEYTFKSAKPILQAIYDSCNDPNGSLRFIATATKIEEHVSKVTFNKVGFIITEFKLIN